jgi:type IV pilus assembly protein PilF
MRRFLLATLFPTAVFRTAAFPTAAFLTAAFLTAAAPLAADERSDAKKQVDFGIGVAQKGLWNEAIFWWEKAAKLDPTYAAAHNNLAIGYEHQGHLDKAKAAYDKALQLEPNNTLIRQNYELFKEINDRTSRAVQ